MVSRMRWVLVVLGLFLVGVFLATAQAGGLAVSGVGAKALGLGGAFRGLADDWSAAYWNPAGLAQLDWTEFGLTINIFSPRPEFGPNITYAGYDVGFKNGATRYPDDKDLLLGHVSGFARLASIRDLAVGLAVFLPYASDYAWDLFDPIYPDIVQPYPGNDHQADFKVVDYHPSVAKSFLDDRLLAGLGISLLRGKFTYRQPVLEPTGLPRPHDNVAIDSRIKASGWGFGANLGIIYKLSDRLRVGISCKTPATIDFDGTLHSDLYGIYNIDLKTEAFSYARTLADSVRLNFIFRDRPEVVGWTRDVEGKLRLPGDIGLGIAYRPNEKAAVTLDVAYTLWSRFDSIVVDVAGTASPIDNSPAQDIVIRTKWENTLRFGVGGQYQVKAPLWVRMGAYYDQSPVPDETVSALLPEVGDKLAGCIGLALAPNQGWQVAYTFEYASFSSRDVTVHSSTLTPSGYDYDNHPGTYKEKSAASFISLSYRF